MIFLFKNENKSMFLNFILIILLPILIFNQGSNFAKKIYFKDKFNIEINSFNKLTKSEKKN